MGRLCAWALGAAALAGCPQPPVETDAGDASARDATDASDATTTDGGAGDVVTDVPTAVDASDAQPVDAAADAGCTPTRVLVGTVDTSMNGGFAVSPIASPALAAIAAPSGVTLSGDHLVRSASCTTFDLRRSAFAALPNSLALIDPANPYVPLSSATFAVIAPGSDAGTPQAADPVDVALVSPTKAYVALYNSARIAIVNPATGIVSASSIDLSPFADADGLPEPGGIAVAGTRAFVSLQRLDRTAGYAAAAHALLAVIDTTTDALIDADATTPGVQAITLSFANPGATDPHIAVSADGTSLVVAEAGGFGGSPVGGIDVVDTASMHVARSITAVALGGAPISAEITSSTMAWAAIEAPTGDAGMVYAIVAFDFATGSLPGGAPVAQSTTYNYGWLRRAPDGSVWALDITFGAPGTVFGFHADGSVLVGSPFAVPDGAGTTSLDFVP